MSLSTVLSSKRKDKKNPQFFYENQSNWRLILTWRKQKLELSVFFGWSPKYELYLYPSKENPKLQKKNIFFLELDTKSFFYGNSTLLFSSHVFVGNPFISWFGSGRQSLLLSPHQSHPHKDAQKPKRKKKTFRARLHIYEYGSVAKLARMLLQED